MNAGGMRLTDQCGCSQWLRAYLYGDGGGRTAHDPTITPAKVAEYGTQNQYVDEEK